MLLMLMPLLVLLEEDDEEEDGEKGEEEEDEDLHYSWTHFADGLAHESGPQASHLTWHCCCCRRHLV